MTELQSLLNDRMIEVGQLKSRLARSNPSSPDRSCEPSLITIMTHFLVSMSADD